MDADGSSSAALAATLCEETDALMAGVRALQTSVTAEISATAAAEMAQHEVLTVDGDGPPWRALRHALAERVAPLSHRDGCGTAEERALAGLERRRVRLQREAELLRDEAVLLRDEARALARTPISPGEWTSLLLAWAARATEQNRQAAAWARRMARLRQQRLHHGKA